MPTARLDDDVYAWLLDHKSSTEKTISAVVRKLIKEKEKTALEKRG